MAPPRAPTTACAASSASTCCWTVYRRAKRRESRAGLPARGRSPYASLTHVRSAMYRTLLPIACSLLPLVAIGDAQIQMVGKEGKIDGTYQVKAGKVRIESVDSGNNTLIYDAANHGITVLDHAKKHYMHIDAET